jgi:hypothetical protein
MSLSALPSGHRAIMASRREPDDSLDFFPTPPWATRALMEKVLPRLGEEVSEVWEPACGEGHMSQVLEHYASTFSSDIHRYGFGAKIDFLHEDAIKKFPHYFGPEWIITNPPFGAQSIPFVLKAIALARVGVAMFFRAQFLEGCERYRKIFKPHPPTLIAHFSERVNLCKGRWDPDGTTATAYVWIVWLKGARRRPPFWIPPGQRKKLTRPDDRERFA